MKRHLAVSTLALLGAATTAQAVTTTITPRYDITTTFYEPDTQPFNSIFIGTFDYDSTTHAVSNLRGTLSESMTGDATAAVPMNWLSLDHQLVSWHDAALGGTFAATFKNTSTATFSTTYGGDGWSPASGIANAGLQSGFPVMANNAFNAYALIFVPDNPVAALTPAQIDKLAYADCAPGGLMMQTCMTGTSIDGYGSVGTMSGYPLSQTITVAAVPEPESYALMLAGLGLMCLAARRRKTE